MTEENEIRKENEIINKEAIIVPQTETEINLDEMTKKVENVFETFEIDERFAERGIRVNLERWNTQKAMLRAMFRKHPGWDEKEQAIFMNFQTERESDIDMASVAVYEIRNRLRHEVDPDSTSELTRTRILYLQCVTDVFTYGHPTLTKNDREALLTLTSEPTLNSMGAKFKASVKEGTRTTRILRKIIDACLEGNDIDIDKKALEQLFAKYADAITPKTITKTAVISLNFCDFLLMSNGNSWSSCHYINTHGLFHNSGDQETYRGMYRRGTLSYAEDDCSFLFYTVPAKLEEDNHLTPKIDRMVCQYKSGYLITGKLYPNNSRELSNKIRHLIQDTLASLVEVPSQWAVTRDVYSINKGIKTCEDRGHYPDYTYEHQNPTRSRLKPLVPTNEIDEYAPPIMTIGYPGYCVCCGKSLDNFGTDGEMLACNAHRNNELRCARCGHSIIPPEDFDPDYDDEFTVDDETFHCIDGEWLCEDCCFYCDYHDRWERGEGTMVSGDNIVCQEALDNNYFYCDYCDKYHPLEEESEKDGVCQDCFNQYFYKCEHCGDIVQRGKTCICQDPDYGKIKKKESYSVGDYVVIGSDLSKTSENCEITDEMAKSIGIIGKVIHVWGTKIRAMVGPWTSWTYETEDIVGALKAYKKSNLYKKYEEVFGCEPEVAE